VNLFKRYFFHGSSALILGMISPLATASEDIEFTTHEGFELETVLREPQVQQPLSINFDERGRMWVTQYRQFPFPKGLKVKGHDKYWRIQYENFPPPPPPNHVKGIDRISIFEDKKGDGNFTFVKTFLDGLNVCTSALPGRGGVWVLNPPYLMFYPDANRDDIPDGDPEVHLAGFGLEDMHAVANSLRWGPDGWLYGYQGSTTTADISRPGIDEDSLPFLGQNLWRYHPETREFELFVEGGHNNFGIALDAKGRFFTGGNGGLIGFHNIQGGYFWKNWGKHGALTNPYAFGFFPGMQDHSSRAKLSQGMVSYDAPNFPEQFKHSLIIARALKRCISIAELKPLGSTFSAHETVENFIAAEDENFRPVDMTMGPDGALYIADWHDTNITWSVSAESERIQRETGRIYRATYGDNTPYKPFDFGKASNNELLAGLQHANKWYRETALRIMYDRKDSSLIPELSKMLFAEQPTHALEALWGIHASGGFTLKLAQKTLAHSDLYIRFWTLRLLGNTGNINALLRNQLEALGANEAHLEVRSQLASTAKRLAPADGLPIALAMLKSGKDVDDPHIPMLLWWVIENHIRQDRAAVVSWVNTMSTTESAIFDTVIVPRLGQRFTLDHTSEDFATCAELLNILTNKTHQHALLEGIAKGLRRGTHTNVPQTLRNTLADLLKKDPSNTQLMIIAARLGDTNAFKQATLFISDSKVHDSQRAELMQLLGEENYADAIAPLLTLFKDGTAGIKQAALSALNHYNSTEVGDTLLESLPNAGKLKPRIAGVLVSRQAWAEKLLAAVDAGTVPASDVDRDLLTNLSALKNKDIVALVTKHWGRIRMSHAETLARVNAIGAIVKNGPGDAKKGVAVYGETCGKCHVLYGIGRTVGPELTGIDRRNIWKLVEEVIDPNKSILPEYAGTIYTIQSDPNQPERFITGFMVNESGNEMTIVDTAGNEVTVLKDHVTETFPMDISIMPEGILQGMDDQTLRDLFQFLQSNEAP